MLDEFSRNLIETAERPSQLDSAETRDLISRAYLRWLAQEIFESNEQGLDVNAFSDSLNRLSLSASILREENGADSDPTAFLIAEASEIARRSTSRSNEDLEGTIALRRAIHYIDLASYYHLSDYDANAAVVAREALSLIEPIETDESVNVADIRLSYYKCLAYFLSGEFGNCRTEAGAATVTSSAEERAFGFLRLYLSELTERYSSPGQRDSELAQRLSTLERALQESEHPYTTLSSETTRLQEFEAAVSRKSLFHILAEPLSEQQDYLRERISSTNNRGYPFAWPPSREFFDSYFNDDIPHSVITVPTGGGKSFLAEVAAAHALQSGWVLYMAPTNALCAQIKRELQDNLSPITDAGIEAFLGNLEYTAELPQFRRMRQILTITPEKALLLLKREPERFKECSLVVLDECHLLGSDSRGDIAEIVLAFSLQQNPDVRVILMSALVRDDKKLADWLENVTNRSVARITLPWRPTRTARLTVLPDPDTRTITRTTQGTRRETMGVRAFADTVTPWEASTPLESWSTPIQLERSGNGRFKWRNLVSRRLAELFTEERLPTLLFVMHNRYHAFSIAHDFDADLDATLEMSQRERDRLTLAEYELGSPSIVAELISENGAAVHISTMLRCERRASEIAFQRGSALLLAATGTLSQGLNLPAEAVVTCGTRLAEYADSSERTPDQLRRRSLNQVLNAAGRAARANITCRGLSVLVPDELLNIDKDAPKQTFFDAIEALALKDASLPVDSSLRSPLEDTGTEQLSSDDDSSERYLLSRLPVESDNLATTVRSTLGLYELSQDGIASRIIQRLESVKSQAISAGLAEWILSAASLAGMDYRLAGHLRDYIASQTDESTFQTPEDSYVGWALFLLDWLRTLPAPETWEILRLHIKAWRYYWGSSADPNLLEELELLGYPENESDESTRMIRPIWKNIEDSVQAWLEDSTFLELGEVLTRRACSSDKRSSRTSAGHHLPRSINWSQKFIERLSRFAGLLLAVQNLWLENEPDSIPDWLAETEALHTFPLGLRFGVVNSSSLTWHRYVIQERRAANLLDSLVPISAEPITDLREASQLVGAARSAFLENGFSDRETELLQVLRRIIREES